MLRREADLMLCAIQFLTRLPTPPLARFEADWISRSARYFPLVGQLVGAFSAAVLLIGARFWPPAVAAAVAVTAAILITGALHEDGLADTVDGLGGGQDQASRLAIMKDSRIGTYGALALATSLLIKVVALAAIAPPDAAALLIFGHGAARFAAVITMSLLPYVGDPALTKVQQAPDRVASKEVAIAGVLTLWPLTFVPITPAVVGAILGVILAKVLALSARRLIGGQTGDVLGAIEQLFEIGFLLGAAAAFRFIP